MWSQSWLQNVIDTEKRNRQCFHWFPVTLTVTVQFSLGAQVTCWSIANNQLCCSCYLWLRETETIRLSLLQQHRQYWHWETLRDKKLSDVTLKKLPSTLFCWFWRPEWTEALWAPPPPPVVQIWIWLLRIDEVTDLFVSMSDYYRAASLLRRLNSSSARKTLFWVYEPTQWRALRTTIEPDIRHIDIPLSDGLVASVVQTEASLLNVPCWTFKVYQLVL